MEDKRYYYCPECKSLQPMLNISWIAEKPFCKSCHSEIEVRYMEDYVVEYNGWSIEVVAMSKENARYKAYLKFHEVYGTSFIDFVRGIESVKKAA